MGPNSFGCVKYHLTKFPSRISAFGLVFWTRTICTLHRSVPCNHCSITRESDLNPNIWQKVVVREADSVTRVRVVGGNALQKFFKSEWIKCKSVERSRRNRYLCKLRSWPGFGSFWPLASSWSRFVSWQKFPVFFTYSQSRSAPARGFCPLGWW